MSLERTLLILYSPINQEACDLVHRQKQEACDLTQYSTCSPFVYVWSTSIRDTTSTHTFLVFLEIIQSIRASYRYGPKWLANTFVSSYIRRFWMSVKRTVGWYSQLYTYNKCSSFTKSMNSTQEGSKRFSVACFLWPSLRTTNTSFLNVSTTRQGIGISHLVSA